MVAALLALTFNTDAAIEDALRVGARILLVVLLSCLAVWLVQRLVSPLLRVAIREQMAGEPEAEVSKRIDTLSSVIYRTCLIAVLVLAVVTILPEFGLAAGPLIAGLGLLGLAVGLGAQNLVKDVLTGLFILAENQYGRGDVVTVAGLSGLVEDINLRRTVLRDFDGTAHIVPHSQITTASNFTKGYARVNLNFSVAYDTDLDAAFEVIDRVGRELAADPTCGPMITQPPQALRVEAFAAGGIVIKVLGETQPMQQWTVAGELRRRLKRACDEAKIVLGPGA